MKQTNKLSSGLLAIGKWIQKIDDDILFYLSHKSHHNTLQPVMKFLSHPPYWRQLTLLMVLGFLIFGSNLVRWRISYLIIAILLSDQTCNILKALVKRVRPDGPRSTKGSFWRKLGHYSFPSSHAANTFAVACLLSHWLPYLAIPSYLLATLISFSRIFQNSHYPSDIVVGGLIGVGYGYLVLGIITWIPILSK